MTRRGDEEAIGEEGGDGSAIPDGSSLSIAAMVSSADCRTTILVTTGGVATTGPMEGFIMGGGAQERQTKEETTEVTEAAR